MLCLLTWSTLSGPPFVSSKRALLGPGVIENKGYMVQRWVQEDGGSVPSNVDPQVFRNRTGIQAITRSGRERRKGGDPDKNRSHLSNRLGTLLSSESIHRKSGPLVYKNAPRTDRNWSPCWHDAENSHFGKTPGTLVTDGEPHATGPSRGSR